MVFRAIRIKKHKRINTNNVIRTKITTFAFEIT
jgi:hypothetical protein